MSGARLMRGIGANALAIATRIAAQFATLPLFFLSWPAERVGIWLLLFALPAYLGIIGTGFAGAGGTASLAAFRRGDTAQARAAFGAAWLTTTLGTAAFALIFALAGREVLHLLSVDPGGVAPGEIAAALGWLALYILASSQIAIAEIPYRVAGRYPSFIVLSSIASLIEVAIIAISVVASDDIATLAMGLALGRSILALGIFIASSRTGPDLFRNRGGNLGEQARALAKPSLAFMAMPVVFGLNLQGYLVLVGAANGPAALAAFAATRTLTRLLDLLTNVAYGLHYYESGYLDGDRLEIQRRILATMTLAALVLSAAFSAILLASGAWLQSVYTAGKTAFDPGVAAILLCAASLRALSAAPLAVIAADNRHASTIALYLAGSAAALGCAILLSFAGFPLALCLSLLIAAEACQFVPAMRAALRDCVISPAAFLRMLASRQRLSDLARLWHRVRGAA